MKIVTECVVCGSAKFQKKFGLFVPFISNCVADYPPSYFSLPGFPGSGYPFLMSNSLKCEACDLVFAQIRFDDDEMSRIYHDYRGDAYNKKRLMFEPTYKDLVDYIGNDPKEIASRDAAMCTFIKEAGMKMSVKSVLDYGGDSGVNIPSMFSDCKKFVYDISGAKCVDGVTGIRDLSEVGTVDFLMTCNLLEHVSYPCDTIKHMKKACGPNTLLFIDVPHEAPCEFDGYNVTIFHEHINFFTKKSLAALLLGNGFKIIKLEAVPLETSYSQGEALFALAVPNWFYNV